MRILASFIAGIWVLLAMWCPAESEPPAILKQWLATQSGIKTWQADVTQTRSIKTLKQPLTSTGKVWVIPPDRFRFELGNPPQTIALRLPEKLYVIYPRLKRVELYPLADDQPGPWRDALALLDVGFSRNLKDITNHFQILTGVHTNGLFEVTLQPRSGTARKMIKEIHFGLQTNDYSLAFNSMVFADGSSMRNDFSHSITNGPLSDTLFELNVGEGFTIVNPLKP